MVNAGQQAMSNEAAASAEVQPTEEEIALAPAAEEEGIENGEGFPEMDRTFNGPKNIEQKSPFMTS